MSLQNGQILRLRQLHQKKKKVETKKTEQIEEIEELDPKTLAPKETTKDIEVDEDEDSESGEMPNKGHGGDTDKYSWTQSLGEVDLSIEVPTHIKGRHLDVKVTATHVKVGIKKEKPLVEGELFAEIVDNMWTLETEGNKKFIVINMEKRKGMTWWKRCIKGDPGIKTKKIQPENSKLEDLDGETRQTVEKMMFDQRQKQMGLPTSKERSQRDKLKAFMDAHPEMDFSQAKFGDQGMGGFGGFGGMV